MSEFQADESEYTGPFLFSASILDQVYNGDIAGISEQLNSMNPAAAAAEIRHLRALIQQARAQLPDKPENEEKIAALDAFSDDLLEYDREAPDHEG